MTVTHTDQQAEHVGRGLLIMTNHSQQQQHSANDAVDEHGDDHEEGEEAGTPLVVHPHNQDDHQRYEHHYGEVDILPCHSPVTHSRDTQCTLQPLHAAHSATLPKQVSVPNGLRD